MSNVIDPRQWDYIMLDAQLVDFNFRQSQLPMVIFTVRATYLIGD